MQRSHPPITTPLPSSSSELRFPSKPIAVGTDHRLNTLRNIASDAKLSMADIAFLSHLPKSTLSRLWDEEDWLDRITGHSLKQLVSVLPELIPHLSRQSCGPRLSRAAMRCRELGLPIRMDRVRSLIESGCAAQRVILALEAAVAIMELNRHDSASYLARCWGFDQDVALDALLAPKTSAKALLADNTLLLNNASQLCDGFGAGRGLSMQTIVARGILVHKTMKLTDQEPILALPETTSNEAFTYRSAVIGHLLSAGDLDIVDKYRRSIDQHPLLRANEVWSLSTYAKDIRQTTDFRVPKPASLIMTATEIVKDTANLNEAYLYYLVSIAVPAILDHDPTFGSRRLELASALAFRLEVGLHPQVTALCVSMIRSLTG